MRILERALPVFLPTVVLFLSGCGGSRSPEEVATAVDAEVPEQPATWTSEAVQGDIQVGWIETFDDTTLTQVVREAQAHNKNLQAAAASVDRARALARQAGAALQPTVDLVAGGTRSGTSATSATNQANIGFNVGWELDLWGRLRSGQRAAAASAQAAAADYRYAQESLAAGVARAYFLAIEAGLQEAVSDETVASLEETQRIVKVRYDNGMVTEQDVELARSDLASARDRLATVQGARRDALRSLEMLLGRYPSAELEVRRNLPNAPPRPPAGVPSEILERRPDLVAVERRVAAAFNAADQARAARLPSIQLTGSVGGSSNDLSSLLDPANTAWRLGANLLSPIFDGGAREAQVEIATAEQEQALAAYGDAALKAFGEVETYLDLGMVLDQRTTELEIALDGAKKAHRIAELRYQEGETDLTDVLSVQQRVFAADNNLVAVRRLQLEQRVNLHLALGGSWQGENE